MAHLSCCTLAHTRAVRSCSHCAAADDGSSCSDMISRQTALSPGPFVCPPKQTVVCRNSAALNSHCCFSFHRAASSKPWLHLCFYLLHSYHPPPSPPPPPAQLTVILSVSSLSQRWASNVSLKRIRDISMSHRGLVGHFSSLVAPPPPPHPFLSEIRFFDLGR